MPDLEHSLGTVDYGHLRIIAEHWGIPLEAPDVKSARETLLDDMLSSTAVESVIQDLPDQAARSLSWLMEEGGRVTWVRFTRRCGSVRDMGPGRRDRERPDLHPDSPAEVLWYRALVSRGFFDTDEGPREYAYIPDDLLPFLVKKFTEMEDIDQHAAFSETRPGRKATRQEKFFAREVNDRIVDHACTMLAALRIGRSPDIHLPEVGAPEKRFIHSILSSMEMIDSGSHPIPERIGEFLGLTRAESMLQLWEGWWSSSRINDLFDVPHLRPEGNWENDPLGTRQKILGFLEEIPRETWWSLSAFIAWVRDRHPDFQRPSGDYDSWFLKDDRTGEYLRGFQNWDRVEGALIRYLISGPFHWLGLLDVAYPVEDEHDTVTAFRFSGWSETLLDGNSPAGLKEDAEPVHIRSRGEIDVSPFSPRSARYQIARFSAWKPIKQERYFYSLTPTALRKAQEQGLTVNHIVSLLRTHTDAVPPNVIRALQRWDQRGDEAVLNQETILRVENPAILSLLKKSKASRYLQEQLGPTAVVIQPGREGNVVNALVELGYLPTSEHEDGDDKES